MTPYARSGSWRTSSRISSRTRRPHREDLPNEQHPLVRCQPRDARIADCRAQALTHILIYCTNFPAFCHHDAKRPIADFPDDLLLDDLQARCRCTRCGKKGAEVRPDWAPVVARRIL
jgi:hypothetical protein